MRTIATCIEQGCAIRGVKVIVSAVVREVSHSERAGTKWERIYLKPVEGNDDFDPTPFKPEDLIVV